MTGARSICLNAYATDNAGKKYDVEVQRADNGADPHRAKISFQCDGRGKSGTKNRDYKELPGYLYFAITENDYYKGWRAGLYDQNMNLTLNRPFNDGAHILYVNGEYRDDSEIGRLMHDFNCTSADEMNFELLAERTRYLKENPKGVSENVKK